MFVAMFPPKQFGPNLFFWRQELLRVLQFTAAAIDMFNDVVPHENPVKQQVVVRGVDVAAGIQEDL